jgi:uroporphyrinogen decarboxylase
VPSTVESARQEREGAITPRQRVIAALERRQTDRLPVMELSIDWNVVRGLDCSGYFDLIEYLDLDAVSVNQVVYLLGLRPLVFRFKKSYTDVWGVGRKITAELLPYVSSHPIRRMEDLRHFRIPDPHRDPVLKAVRRVARRFKGRRAVMLVGRAVFAASWYLCGMERLLESYLLDPVFATSIGRMVIEYNKELHRLAIAEGVDLIVLGDDYAHKTGTIMSPALFREFILPGLTEVVGNIKAGGAYCVKHTDGNIWAILEDIVNTGIDGIGPLEPAAGMDLGKVKGTVGDRVCVVGNVDVDLLCRGSAEEVHKATRALIASVSPGGGHILSSGNSITSAVRPENFRTMVETAHDYGRYPIDLQRVQFSLP